MSVIQISKIQIRRGQTGQTNFPQLASGEFGWSIDQQELYIGNGAVSEGAPAVGNTRVITEADINNLFLITNTEYTYKATINNSSTVITGINKNYPVVRPLQDRLDDQNTIYNFGAVGDGLADDTAAIQRAIFQSFNTVTSANLGPLYFPAGTYNITATIYIPPYAELRGTGAGKTIIKNVSNSTIFQTTDRQGHQLGSLITGDISSAVCNVNINGITFNSTLTNSAPLLRLDCVVDSKVSDCEFVGSASSSTQAAGIELRGGVVGSTNIHIESCKFYQLGKGVYSNYDVDSVNIAKNRFERLDKGIVLAETLSATTGSFTGPLNVLISDNAFVNINYQGIYAGANNRTDGSNISSVDNYFENVGNGYNNPQGDLAQITEIVAFGSTGNSSENDKFSRLNAINSATLFSTTTQVKPIVTGPVLLKFNSPKTVLITSSATPINPGTILVYPISTSVGNNQIIDVDYTVYRPATGVTRRGKVNLLVTTATTAIKDDFTYIGSNDGDIKFRAILYSGKQVRLEVTGGGNATITYTYTVRQ